MHRLYNFRFWLKKIFRCKRKLACGDILYLIIPTIDSYDIIEVEVIKEKRKYVVARSLTYESVTFKLTEKYLDVTFFHDEFEATNALNLLVDIKRRRLENQDA